MKHFLVFIASIALIISCNNKKEEKVEAKELKLKEENVSYSLDTVTMNGFVVYDENFDGPRPAVIVVHEWWGLNEYPKMRARELAKLGYVAMAADIYGNGKTVDNPTDAQNMATPFYQDPQMAKARLDAAIAKLKT